MAALEDLPDGRLTFGGWCTVESEPAVFNQILLDLGVQGARVAEVYSLDDESLQSVADARGLIFLFRWKDEDEAAAVKPEDGQDDAAADGPAARALDDAATAATDHAVDPVAVTDTAVVAGGVWFANQIAENACASVALLNIVLNCSDMTLGPHLDAFRAFTASFVPPLRGLALANFEYLRHIHNQYGRPAEVREAEIELVRAAKRKRVRPGEATDAFHFVAYVPADGALWELDGLKEQPAQIGTYAPCGADARTDSWVAQAAPHIRQRIERYAADEIRFNLLAVVPEPVADGAHDLAELQTYALRRRHDYTPFVRRMIAMLADDGLVEPVVGV
ncbi:ubiquitin carboxyl-terminal hydrolase [Dipodascopsis tothii]|uniref:ubiquitin carboxyl-terminal hydrolase n=1 Tax=Dipodascopsis tothii TaxID=44089 RepID=UPI0034CEDC8C